MRGKILLCVFIAQCLVGCCIGIKSYVLELGMGFRSPDCVEKAVILINGKFPGPTIRATASTMIEVKVVNNLPTEAVTVHFHGQVQLNTIWQDGVSMVTSCPIPPGTSFTHRFRVNDAAGTYIYHGHAGAISAAGLYGMFIIDPVVGKQFDYAKEHSLLLSDWAHLAHTEVTLGIVDEHFKWSGDPQSILINGKGYFNCTKNSVPKQVKFPYFMQAGTIYCADKFCPGYETVEVEKGTVNLIRIANIAEISFMNIAIQDHNMTVVEADGHKIKPLNVRSLDLFSGQRYAVLITANQPVSTYWINVKTRHRSGVVTGQAVLKYKTSSLKKPPSAVEAVMTYQPKWDDSAFSFAQQNSMEGLTSPPAKVTRRIVLVGTQQRFEWSKGVTYNDPSKSRPEDNCNATGRALRWALNGVSYKYENTPIAHMVYYGIRPETFTEKRGYYKINQGDVIDVIIQNYPGCNQVCEAHPWHLHGYKFWVLGMGHGTWNGNATQLASLKTSNAVVRDTINVLPDSSKPFAGQAKQGGCGWVAIRFVADNPGVWSFHCHVTWHFVMGMHVIFIDSADKMPAPGNDIPICGEITPNHSRQNVTVVKKEEKSCNTDIGLFAALGIGWFLAVCFLAAAIYLYWLKMNARARPPNDGSPGTSMSNIKNPNA